MLCQVISRTLSGGSYIHLIELKLKEPKGLNK